MYLLVGREVAVEVQITIVAQHLLMQSLYFRDFLISDIPTGELASQSFQSAHDRENLIKVFLCDLANTGSPIWFKDNQAFASQNLQCFTQGCARDGICVAQVFLRDLHTGRQGTMDDQIPQCLSQFFMK